jgi:hypothetical protein
MVIDMARHHQERFFLPTPILEHLARAFNEVALDSWTAEHGQRHIRAEIVHHVPELCREKTSAEREAANEGKFTMKVGDDFSVAKKARNATGRLGEVGDHGSRRLLALALRLQTEHGRIAILADARMQV